MKCLISFYILLFLFQISIRNSLKICECQYSYDQSKFYVDDCLVSCKKECNLVTCYRYDLMKNEVSYDLYPGNMLVTCKTQKSNNSNISYVLYYEKICDLPSNIQVCYTTYINIYTQKEGFKITSCKAADIKYVLPCQKSYNSYFCTPTNEMREKFSLGQTIKIYFPPQGEMTFDHFILSEGFIPNEIPLEYAYQQEVDALIKNKDMIDIDYIKRIAQHAFHTYNPETKTELTQLTKIINQNENIYVEVGFDPLLKAIIIAFRGTTYHDVDGKIDFNNIMNDIYAVQRDFSKCSNCKVHTGFFNSIEKVVYQIKNDVSNLFNSRKSQIIITGHSYGGALASLMSTYLYNYYYSNVITFGQPRTGNRAYSEYVNSLILGKSFRVTFADDPIVNVPFKDETESTYYHHGTEVHFSKAEDLFERREKDIDQNTNNANPLNIDDHSGYRFLINSTFLVD